MKNFKSVLLLTRRRICVLNICCMGARTRKHLERLKKLTLNVSQMFLCLHTHARCVEDAELASREQHCNTKCFYSSVRRPLIKPLRPYLLSFFCISISLREDRKLFNGLLICLRNSCYPFTCRD